MTHLNIHVRFTNIILGGFLLFCSLNSVAQTTLISPTGDGGFESGATPALNNWTAVNSSTDSWVVGSAPVVSDGTGCAYISSTSGTTWAYSQLSVIQHLYYNVTIPANETLITLTFKWKAAGEGPTISDYDNMKVFFAPNAVTPVANAAVSSTYQISGAGATSGMYKLSPGSYNAETITFFGTPGASYRLIFSWKSDISLILNPPAALDEVSLVSYPPVSYVWNKPAGGVFTDPANWTPTRSSPVTTDILVFDGPIAAAITSVPTQIIGRLKLQNNATPNLMGSSTTLTISGATGTNLDVPFGTTLTLTGAGIVFSGTQTADIAGTVNVGSNTTYSATNTTTFVTGTMGNAGTITSNTSTLIFDNGSFYNHNFTTTGGVIPTATWNTGSTVQILGYTTGGPPTGLSQTFSNFIYNCTNQSLATTWTGSAPTAITGTLTIASTNSQDWGWGSSQSPIWIVNNFIQTNGTLNFASGAGNARLRVSGTFNQSGGTITEGGSGTTNTIEFNGTSNQSVTIAGTISNTLNFTVNNTAGIALTGTIPINTGAVMTTNGPLTGGAVIYTGSTTLVYNGTSSQTTSNVEFPSSNGPTSLTINNAAGVTLHASRSLATLLTLTAGVLSLGNNDLSLGGTISVISPTITKMVQTNGTGQLKKTFNSGASLAFTFPVGENTGTTEYTPITFNFSANSIQRTIGIRVVDADPPSNGASTNYISRYWAVTNDAGGTFTYGGTMVYTEADVNGTEGDLRVQFYSGSVYSDVTNTINTGSNTLSITAGATEAITPFDGTGNTVLTGRKSPPGDYTWNGTTSSAWAIASNWTPNGVPDALDNAIIGTNSPNPAVVSSATSITSLTLNGTGSLTVNASTTLTVGGTFTYDNSGGATASLNASSTVNLSSSSAVTIPALNYGHLTRSGLGATTLSSTGTIGIAGIFTPGTASYTTTGSTVDFTGAGSQTIPAFSYNNLSNSGNGARTLSSGSGIINIAGTYSPTSAAVTVNTGTIDFTAAGSQTIPASSYYNLSNSGNGNRTLANSGTIFIANAFSPGSGTHTTTGSTITYNGSNPITLAPYPYNNLAHAGTGTVSLGAGVDLVVGGNFSMTGNGIFNVGNTAASSNTMTVNGNFDLTGGCMFCNFILINNATSTGATLTVNGNMTLAGGSSAIVDLERVSSSTGAGVINVLGDFTATGTTTSGIINFGGSGITLAGNRVAISGNFSKSGTGAFFTTGSPTGANVPDGFVFNKAGTQTFSYIGNPSSYISWQVGAGSTLQLTTGLAMGAGTSNPPGVFTINSGGTLDCGTNAISGGSSSSFFTLASGGTLKTAIATGVTGTITIPINNNKTFSSLANYEFQGAATGTFTTSPTALTVANLTINNGSGDVTMGQAFTVNGDLKLAAGRLLLGNNILTTTGSFQNAGGAAFTMGVDADSYIVTNGTGKLTQPVTASVPKIFPVGLTSPSTFNPLSLTTNLTGNYSVILDNTVDNSPLAPTKLINTEYNITSTVGPTDVSLTTQFETGNGGTNFNFVDPKVIGHFVGMAWEEKTATYSGSDPFLATAGGFTSLSPFAPGNKGSFAMVLPIELVSFNAVAKNKTNDIFWVTASQENVAFFILERSPDGRTWSILETLAAEGTTLLEKSYALEDPAPFCLTYYRLRAVDFDGQEEIFNTEVVTRECSGFTFGSIYPNPAGDEITVEFSMAEEAEADFTWTDVNGKVLAQEKMTTEKGLNQKLFSLVGFPNGVYFLFLRTGNEMVEQRVVKQ